MRVQFLLLTQLLCSLFLNETRVKGIDLLVHSVPQVTHLRFDAASLYIYIHLADACIQSIHFISSLLPGN